MIDYAPKFISQGDTISAGDEFFILSEGSLIKITDLV
jgi:hypothetical protein